MFLQLEMVGQGYERRWFKENTLLICERCSGNGKFETILVMERENVHARMKENVGRRSLRGSHIVEGINEVLQDMAAYYLA